MPVVELFRLNVLSEFFLPVPDADKILMCLTLIYVVRGYSTDVLEVRIRNE
jgi:hypothetical protein